MLALAFLLGAAGCAPQEKEVFVEVDHGRRVLTTDAPTVRDVLKEAGIELGELDRVKPDLYAEAEHDMVIVVTRVKEEFVTRRVVVPFESRRITNEALPPGETRLVQLGVNGETEITYRVLYEDGEEVSRTEVSQLPITEPVDEIIVVGSENTLPSVPIEGTIAYISGGNAWVMRDASGNRRPLTTEGDLDGHVFDLSPDGRYLLFSRRLEGTGEEEDGTPINTLWVITTTVMGVEPFTVPISGALYSEWSPDGSQVAYSTAERASGSPNWRANNDLWLLDFAGEMTATQILTPTEQGMYSWWGDSFAWSPDGGMFAFADAEQVRVFDVASDTGRSLYRFKPYQTYSSWVWVPPISWSPDGGFIATVIHGPGEDETLEQSEVFDLWVLGVDADGRVKVKVDSDVGMWSGPAWGEMQIAYGSALMPLSSVDSRYEIYVMDRDGSNRLRVFPQSIEPGVRLPQLAWSPGGDRLLFIYNGDLYVVEHNGGHMRRLTGDGQSTGLCWSK